MIITVPCFKFDCFYYPECRCIYGYVSEKDSKEGCKDYTPKMCSDKSQIKNINEYDKLRQGGNV